MSKQNSNVVRQEMQSYKQYILVTIQIESRQAIDRITSRMRKSKIVMGQKELENTGLFMLCAQNNTKQLKMGKGKAAKAAKPPKAAKGGSQKGGAAPAASGDDIWSNIKQFGPCAGVGIVVALVVLTLYILLADTIREWINGPYECNRVCRGPCRWRRRRCQCEQNSTQLFSSFSELVNIAFSINGCIKQVCATLVCELSSEQGIQLKTNKLGWIRGSRLYQHPESRTEPNANKYSNLNVFFELIILG